MKDRLLDLARRFGSNQSGSALLEVTLIVPLMITLSAGVFEFSNIIHTRLLVEAGLTDGARFYARCRHEDADAATCATSAQLIAAQGDSGSARVVNWVPADVTVTYTPIAITIDPSTGLQNYRSTSDHIGVVTLSTSYSYAGTGLLQFLGFSPLVFSLDHEERVIGW